MLIYCVCCFNPLELMAFSVFDNRNGSQNGSRDIEAKGAQRLAKAGEANWMFQGIFS